MAGRCHPYSKVYLIRIPDIFWNNPLLVKEYFEPQEPSVDCVDSFGYLAIGIKGPVEMYDISGV